MVVASLAFLGLSIVRTDTITNWKKHAETLTTTLDKKKQREKALEDTVETLTTTLDKKKQREKALEDTVETLFWSAHAKYVHEVLFPRAKRCKAPPPGEGVFTKKVRKHYGPWPSRLQFLVELDCLSLLNSLNLSPDTRKPFPTLFDWNFENLTFEMSNCGISVDKLREKIFVPDVISQAKVIAQCLEAAGISYWDMHPSGKNLVVDSHGRLSIIDFGHAQAGNLAITKEKDAHNVEERILRICENNPNIVLE